MHFFPNFRQILWIGMFTRVIKEQMRCPVGFSEKFISSFNVKMSQINTENYKKKLNFSFFKVFMQFC